MSGLLEEYRKRHAIDYVCGINEGRLFFNIDDQPAFIVLTSSYTKCFRSCSACYEKSDCVTLEVFSANLFPECARIVTHVHLNPDESILDQVNKSHQTLFPFTSGTEKITPFVANSERSQEMWLWNLFNSLSPLDSPYFNQDEFSSSTRAGKAFKKIVQDQIKKKIDPELMFQEQVMWYSKNAPALLQTFYNDLYSLCMIGRKYILNG